MNCRLFEGIVADLDRGEVLPSALRDAALEHAESCANCGLLLTESESLDMNLRTLAASADTESAPMWIESSLLNEFRVRHGNVRRGKLRWQVAAVGIAAAAAFAASLFFSGHIPWRHASPGQNARTGESRLATHAPPAVPEVRKLPSETNSNEALEATTGAQRTAPRHVTPTQQAEPEEAAFIPLPYADTGGRLEGGEVVRVILTPEALESLGVRTNDFGSNGAISADLLLDEAGTPEAIRLVAQADANLVNN